MMDLSESTDPGENLSDSDSKCTKENLTTITESNIGVNVDTRVARNVTERKRKEKIKMFVGQLKEMLPADFLPELKRPMSHNVILETVVTYVRHLKQQNELLLQSKGSQVQCEEINRLKRELASITKEKDTYEKMVKSAAVHTSSLFPQLTSAPDAVSSASPPQQAPAPITTTAGQRLPGQGLIITQNGQAYYVNEEGVPIAQGVAPPQLLADSLVSKSLAATANLTVSAAATTAITTNGSTASCPVTSTTSCTATTSSTAASTTSSSLSHFSASAMSAGAAAASGGVCNGLVAVPGHTGQLPSAIILPNGQVIPVVTSSGQTPPAATNCGTLSTNTPNSALTSTASSSLEVTSTTTSLSSNVMLLGQQPTLNNLVLSTNQLPANDCSNLLGRKIMPKPQLLTPFPRGMNMMTSVSLTPLPVPTCSVTAAPEIPLPGKKKRTRKKKAKGSDGKTSDDILAAATASLFSPKKPAVEKAGDASTLQKENIDSETSSSHIPQASLTYISTSANSTSATTALPTVSTNKKPQKRKPKSDKSNITEKNSGSSKKSKANTEKIQVVDGTSVEGFEPPMDTSTNSQPAAVADKPAANDAIEFDPNELDMVLDQVEGNISDHQLKITEPNVSSSNDTNSYQVLDEGADIGHIFSTSTEAGQDKPKSTSPITDAQSSKAMSTELSQPNYCVSESYLIGNLTKTAEPVDHRWLGESSITVTKHSDALKACTKPWSTPLSEPKSVCQASTPVTQSPLTTSSPENVSKISVNAASDVNQYFGKYFHQRSSIFKGEEEPVEKSALSIHKTFNETTDTGASSPSDTDRSNSATSHKVSPLSSNSAISKSTTKSTFSPFYSPVHQEPQITSSHQPQMESRVSPLSSNSAISKSTTKPTFSPFYSPVPREPQITSSHQPQMESRVSPLSSNSAISKSSTKPSFTPFYSPVPQEPQITGSHQPQMESRVGNESVINAVSKLSSTHHATRAEPKWSPARDSERSKIQNVIATPYSSVAQTQPSPACPEGQWQNKNSIAGYNYRGLNSQSPISSDTQNRPSGTKHVPTDMQQLHNPMLWSNQPAYHPYQSQQSHQPHQQQPTSAPVCLSETNTSSHHANAFSSLSPRHMREQQQSLHNLDNSHPVLHERATACNQINSNPKSHAFSAESLLNKSTERRNQPIHPTPGRSFPPAVCMNNQAAYNKPYASSTSNNVPFNVNLFTSQPSAFKRQGNFHGGSYIPNAEQNAPFTFSLTKTTDSSLTSSYATNQQGVPLYSKSSQQQPTFPPPQHQQQQPSPAPVINFHSSINPAEQLKSSRDYRQTNQPLFQEPNAHSSHLTSTTELGKKTKKPRSKPVANQSSTVVANKIPTSQQQAAGSFHHLTNDFTNSSDIFSPPKITSQINPPFNLPFQPGFGAVQPHVSSPFPSHSGNLASGPRFNINNFFKDSAIDSFRFSNPAHSSTMYSPAPPFYPNPMGIGNILGSGHAGIDVNRPTPLATHPGFHSFHHSLDFQLADQTNGA